MLALRSRRPDEPDYELWGLAVVVSTGLLGFAWLKFGPPPPVCWFHALTGVPCLTCGGTRCLRSLIDGRVLAAAGWNPLIFVGALAAAGFAAYAAMVTIFRLPRVRVAARSRRQMNGLRAGAAFLLAANWIYLVFRLSRGP